MDILEDRMKLKTNKEWNQVMEGAKFPYGPVNRLKEVFEDPQVEHNQMMRTMPDGTFGDIKQVGPAVKFSSAINQPRSPPPRLGQHTDEVLTNVLGYSPAEIAGFRKNKIVH